MVKAVITSGGVDWIRVRFDYDEGLKDALMQCVGQGNYRWSPSLKAWSYRRTFYSKVVSVFESYDYEIVGNGAFHARTLASVQNNVNPWSAVFDSLDNELGHRIYRALALIVHPDQGGDTKIMQLVNDAWAERHK